MKIVEYVNNRICFTNKIRIHLGRTVILSSLKTATIEISKILLLVVKIHWIFAGYLIWISHLFQNEPVNKISLL